MKLSMSVSLLALAAAGCTAPNTVAVAPAAPVVAEVGGYPLTPAGAEAFTENAEAEYLKLSHIAGQADWVNSTYITDDTDAISAYFGTMWTELGVKYANQAAQFAKVDGLDADTARKLDMLRSALTLAAPTTPADAAANLNQITSKLQSQYGKGQAMLDGKVLSGSEAEKAMGELRDPAKLAQVWESWHDSVGKPMKGDYQRMVAIANAGAQELGFDDTGAMWRSKYDMEPAEFSAMYDRLWTEVEPLYASLHTYVRGKLHEEYGATVQPATGPIRADILGNMWAQSWGNVYDLVAPEGAGDIGYDIGDLLKAKDMDQMDMFRIGEGFFSSLGLAPMPDSFWERSQFVKPEGRDVVCHASAWDVDNVEDLRIKMCTNVDSEDFITIHHEFGHNYYQRAYNQQPYLYREGANDGFHEAIGDFVALSITPQYLVQIGLLDASKVPDESKDTGLLLRQAMDKVAFLPFGLLVDKWRWGVFDGSTTPAEYNASWVALKQQYQGVTPPVARDANDFDPGAKYHIPGNTPYARYFLAHLLQFQFYKAACDQIGWEGPLHRCSFYGNKEVGAKLNAMMEMGASKPWPDALEAFTGTREISAKPMLEYFAPLQTWLDEQNKGKTAGW